MLHHRRHRRRRVDVIYEVLRGRVFLFCNVSQADQPSVINGGAPPPGRPGHGWALWGAASVSHQTAQRSDGACGEMQLASCVM